MNSRLTDQEVSEAISSELRDWSLDGIKIKKEWRFKNFIQAFGFITKIALISESMNHHPDLRNVYSQVTVELTTHDLEGISQKDIDLAKAIDNLLIES